MSVERRGPAVCNGSNKKGGKGEMIKTPISLQDLRRSLYVKAKAEPTWRFWGLYVHVCKMETLEEAYRMAKNNDGAPQPSSPQGEIAGADPTYNRQHREKEGWREGVGRANSSEEAA